MVSTYVEEERLLDDISRKIEAAEKLEDNIAATDRQLAMRQDQLYSGDDEVYRAAIGDVRRDISVASARTDGWKAEIDRLEKDFSELRSKADRLSSGDRDRASERLRELRRELDAIRLRLTSVDDRITDMLDRVLYITERH
jgi:chromosome segregation ATPase